MNETKKTAAKVKLVTKTRIVKSPEPANVTVLSGKKIAEPKVISMPKNAAKKSEKTQLVNDISKASSKKSASANVAAPMVKRTKAEVAEQKKIADERNEMLYRITSVLVPLHFGNDSVDKVFKSTQLRPEVAISLMFIGSQPGGTSETSISIDLHQSGFDRREAMLIPFMGMASMIGSKLGKWVGKRDDDASDDVRSGQKMVLTAKGQKIFDVTKRSVLSPWSRSSFYF